MCLGIPAQVTAIDEGHADLVEVDMAGVRLVINVGVLDDGQSPAVGDWLLVHMGFALAIISAEEARDALEVFEDERTAAAALMGSQEDR